MHRAGCQLRVRFQQLLVRVHAVAFGLDQLAVTLELSGLLDQRRNAELCVPIAEEHRRGRIEADVAGLHQLLDRRACNRVCPLERVRQKQFRADDRPRLDVAIARPTPPDAIRIDQPSIEPVANHLLGDPAARDRAAHGLKNRTGGLRAAAARLDLLHQRRQVLVDEIVVQTHPGRLRRLECHVVVVHIQRAAKCHQRPGHHVGVALHGFHAHHARVAQLDRLDHIEGDMLLRFAAQGFHHCARALHHRQNAVGFVHVIGTKDGPQFADGRQVFGRTAREYVLGRLPCRSGRLRDFLLRHPRCSHQGKLSRILLGHLKSFSERAEHAVADFHRGKTRPRKLQRVELLFELDRLAVRLEDVLTQQRQPLRGQIDQPNADANRIGFKHGKDSLSDAGMGR